MRPQIDIDSSRVVFEDQTIQRPLAWSPTSWVQFWEWIKNHDIGADDYADGYNEGYDIGYEEGYNTRNAELEVGNG